jgi:hypothetical protein
LDSRAGLRVLPGAAIELQHAFSAAARVDMLKPDIHIVRYEPTDGKAALGATGCAFGEMPAWI